MEAKRPIVLKFGSSVLRDTADLPAVVHEVYRYVRAGRPVVAVVSAMGDTTDRLLRETQALEAEGGSRHLPGLLATGEQAAAALLSLALERSGVPVRCLDAFTAGLRCEGDPLDAVPVSLEVSLLLATFDAHAVAVLPGFVGVGDDDELALFGRGGTDLTAIFVARRLGAECRLIKDVDGLYERDPALPGPRPRRFGRIRWEDAEALEGGIVQHKAVRHAREVEQEFDVAALGATEGTHVGSAPSSFAPAPEAPAPLRVALLGLGQVGGGVYRALARRPADFQVSAVLVREPGKDRGFDVPASLLTDRLAEALDTPHDVLVELLGGTDIAGDVIESALRAGCDVVSANKALVATRGPEFEALAHLSGAVLRSSAAVGGAVPAIERVRMLAAESRIEWFEGVLNGTTNFVLDRLVAGDAFEDAVRLAQERGFAEADPTLDLDGTDCVQKVEILARAAFPGAPPVEWRERRGILEYAHASPVSWRAPGLVPRLVATCELSSGRPIASVQVRRLPHHHPLAGLRGAQNALAIRLAGGGIVRLWGLGAGRWPTTESVLGDLFELRGQRASQSRPTAYAS